MRHKLPKLPQEEFRHIFWTGSRMLQTTCFLLQKTSKKRYDGQEDEKWKKNKIDQREMKAILKAT